VLWTEDFLTCIVCLVISKKEQFCSTTQLPLRRLRKASHL
jgi:hypothetical protein